MRPGIAIAKTAGDRTVLAAVATGGAGFSRDSLKVAFPRRRERVISP
jgi:hypothetical protein